MARRFGYLFADLTWSRVAWTTVIAAVAAGVVKAYFVNTYWDLLISALVMSYCIMVAITVAGNLRQRWLPREGAQLLAVVLASMVGIVLVGIVKGRDLSAMFTERLYSVAITVSLGVGFGSVFTAMLIVREQRARLAANLSQAEADRHRLEKQVMASRLQVLQAQVEPHFLFNTLANVQHLVESDPKSASRMLDNLIRYLRIALPQMRESTSTLGREMDMAAAYLEIFKMRMGARLTYRIDLPAALRSEAFPPMLLITLVENAIKHGIDPSCDAGEVNISAASEGDSLVIKVADTGEGFKPTSGGGVGLANIRERLATLYGKAAKCLLEENHPRGVVASLILPRRDGLLASR